MNGLTNISSIYDFNSIQGQSKLNNIKENISLVNKNDSEFSKMLGKSSNNKTKNINPDKLQGKEKKLYNTCVDMESLLWKQVLNAMKKTINKYKLVDGGMAEEIFSDMLYDRYSLDISKQSKTGLAQQMYDQMSKFL